MIAVLGAIFLVAGFVVIFKACSMLEKSKNVMRLAQSAFSDIRNPDMDDNAKESALQEYAKKLFLHFLYISMGGAAALLLPTAVIWLLQFAGLLLFEDVMAVALSWPFILTSTIIFFIVYSIYQKK